MPSTQVAVKSALKTAIAAAVPGVAVFYGEPGELGKREFIAVGLSVSHREEPEGFHKTLRLEDYNVFVYVFTSLASEPEGTETRAMTLVETIERTVVDNTQTPPFGVAGVAWIRPAGIELQTNLGEGEQPISRARVSFNVKARLQ